MKGKTMSKIFEALENAEKQRLRNGSSPFLKENEEKKIAPALEPKSERIERPATSLAPEPREEKKTAPVVGPRPTPAPETKVEKKPAPIPGPKEVHVERPANSFSPAPREEKKTLPVLEPKSGWVMERPAPSPVPEHREVKRTTPVVAPAFTPAPAPREEKRTSPALEPKSERMERPAPSPVPEPKVEKKSAPIPGLKEERMERPAASLAPEPPRKDRVEKTNVVHNPVRLDRLSSDHPLVSLSEPGSLGAEQFRRLRTHVLKLNVSDPPKTIMVTSATEGEGKTFVAANLAAGIAHDLHFHALLVDCDLRSPALSHWFGVQNGHGLSDYLVGKGQLSELILKTEMEKLSILTGGSVQAKPAELIGSRKMEALVNELKLRYNDRYIILDATPLLATTEPEVLARLVDGILIVVRAGVTPRETVKQAVASLDPKKILGFVLNDVEFKSSGLSSRYFGSSGYYTRYGYGIRKAEPRSPLKDISSSKKKSG